MGGVNIFSESVFCKGVSIGPGAFAKGLEFSTGVQPEVVGKPNPVFYQSPLLELSIENCEAVMIGDDARDDVNGAVAAGLKGILVKTGKYAKGDEEFCPEASYHAKDFADAVEFLI